MNSTYKMNRTYKIILMTILYYIASLGLGFFTSFFLSVDSYNFRFPLFKSSIQNLVQFIVAFVILKIKRSKNNTKYMYSTIPCAITGAIDIGLSSYSLRKVSLAFYTMVKSSSPVFILLSGMLFGIENPSISFFLIIFTIGCGVCLTSYKNSSFDLNGFNIIICASFMAGFRWAFTQYLIHNKDNKNRMYCTIRDLCLPISLILFIMSVYFEGFNEIVQSEFFNTPVSAARNFGFIIVSGLLSFLLVYSEFNIVAMTSVVFLSVSSIVKELIIVFVALYGKKIHLSALNYFGLAISITGIMCYNYKRM